MGDIMTRKFIVACIMLFAAVNCYAVSVGDSIGGGTVFCVSDTKEGIKNCKTTGSGVYALVMANVDQANLDSPKKGITWSKGYSTTNVHILTQTDH